MCPATEWKLSVALLFLFWIKQVEDCTHVVICQYQLIVNGLAQQEKHHCLL